MQIGFARRDISPPVLADGDLSIPILGFRHERAKAYREIHDPLSARAMALRTECGSALVLGCDLFGDALGFMDQVALRLEQTHGVPADNVFFGATHTHTSPDTLNICRHPVAAWWIERLTDDLVATAATALGALRPASLHWAELTVPGLAVNRRRAALEKYEATHGPVTPRFRARATALDETLRVLCAIDGRGQPFGAVMNFACHPVIMQTAPMISADFWGPATALVEKALGPGFVCVHLNGPCGDVNPACGYTADYSDCEQTGRILGEAAVVALQRAMRRPALNVPAVSGTVREITVRRQDVPDLAGLRAEQQRLEAACAAADSAGLTPADGAHPLRDLVLVRERLAVADLPLDQAAPVQALRLGEVTFISFPGEMFTVLGQDVRQGVSGRIMLAECSRSHLGYICSREAYTVGGYELGPGTWSWLAKGAGEFLADTAVDAARTL